MSKINKAVERLKAARDLLADKIAETVNEAGDDFATDFVAGGYRGEAADELIEMGERLYKLNYLIGAMPVEIVPFNSKPIIVAPFNGGSETWEDFVDLSTFQDLGAASYVLQQLLRIDLGLAMRSTAHFSSLMSDDPATTKGLLSDLIANHGNLSTTASLDLLRLLFNLQGDTAVSVYQRLKESI